MVREICCAETADVFPGIIARNRAVLEYEKFVHRTFYPFIIHPHSRFRVYWEIFMLVLIPFRLITTTFLWVFFPSNTLVFVFIVTTYQVVNLVDIFLKFFTGYVDSKTQMVILEPRKIIPAYLLKSFIFDVIPCIPVSIILYIFPEYGSDFYDSSNHLGFILYLIEIFIFFQMVSFFLYLYHTSNLFMWYPYLLGIVCTISFVALFFVFVFNSLRIWVTDMNKIIKNLLDNLVTIQIRLTICSNLVTVFLEYLNNSAYTDDLDFIVRFTYLLVIFFSSIFLIVYLIKFTLLKMKSQEKFHELESKVLGFAKKRHLSVSLTDKVLLYFLILLENKYCKEDEIFQYIPDTFKAEIFFHLCLPLLKNFNAFEGLPTYVLRRLAECLVYQLHLPNELVMTMSERTLSMYFVQRGTLALYSANHVELYHFEAGSSINGRNFILGDSSSTHYAISIEVTEVYRLDYDNYMDIMSAYPMLLKNITRKFQLVKSKVSFADYASPWD